MKLFSDIKNINKYILNPYHFTQENINIKEKIRIFFSALFYIFLIDFLILIPLLSLIEEHIITIDFNKKFNKETLIDYIIFGGIAAPLIEELLFRLPLNYDDNYLFNVIQNSIKSKKINLEKFWIQYFKPIFYFFALTFAYIHILNYENNELIFYLLSPLIVLPQFIAGLIWGYLRMKLGYWWSVSSHSFSNIILLFFSLLYIYSFEKKETNFHLKIEELSFYNNKEIKKVDFNEKTITSIHWNDETVQKLIDTLYKKKYKDNYNHLAKISLTTTKPISKEKLLTILKEEYQIVERGSLK